MLVCVYNVHGPLGTVTVPIRTKWSPVWNYHIIAQRSLKSARMTKSSSSHEEFKVWIRETTLSILTTLDMD